MIIIKINPETKKVALATDTGICMLALCDRLNIDLEGEIGNSAK